MWVNPESGSWPCPPVLQFLYPAPKDSTSKTNLTSGRNLCHGGNSWIKFISILLQFLSIATLPSDPPKHSFLSMKWIGVLPLLPEWDASPMQGYPPAFHQASLTICCTHLYSWVPKNTMQWPGPRPLNLGSCALIMASASNTNQSYLSI